jgi:hypothetical protein
MYLGSSPFLYSFLTGLVTIAFVFLSLSDWALSLAYLWSVGDPNIAVVDKIKQRNYNGPYYLSFCFVVLVFTTAGVWITNIQGGSISGVQQTAEWNYKVIWLMTRMFLFTVAIFIDWLNHASRAFYPPSAVPKVGEKETPSTDEGVKAQRIYRTKVGFATYILSALVLTVYLCMMIACQWVFNSNMTIANAKQKSQIIDSPTLAANTIAALLLVSILLFEIGFRSTQYNVRIEGHKKGYGSLGTKTANIIEKLKNEGAMIINLDKVNLATDMAKFDKSSFPLTFIPTGAKVYEKNHETALLHHIENKIKAEQNPSVSIKNFVGVHIPLTNEVLVLNDDEAHELYKASASGELNYAKYGLLAPTNNISAKNAQDVIDSYEGSENQMIKNLLEARNEKFQRMGIKMLGFSDPVESPVLKYNTHIMGFGVGNGTWYNYPLWMAFCITVLTLAADIAIWGDGGAGLIDWLICTLSPFFFALLGYEGGWYQLFIRFMAIGTALIVVQGWFTYPGPKQYLMDVTVVYSNSSAWLQNSTYTTTNVFDEQVSSYVALFFVSAYCVGYLILACLRYRAK